MLYSFYVAYTLLIKSMYSVGEFCCKIAKDIFFINSNQNSFIWLELFKMLF